MNRVALALLLLLGAGMLLIALRGLLTGTLPAGRGGGSTGGEVRRAERPVTFWLVFLADLAIAVLCLHAALRGL